MLDTYQEQLLLRALRSGSCVLYTGSGFSATSASAGSGFLPTSWRLAELLWEFVGLGENGAAYSGQDLQQLFDHCVRMRGEESTLAFLKSLLLATTVPDSLLPLTEIFWHRIYTTNVDNVLETLYRGAVTARLDVVNALQARPRERDQFLGSLQYVKLNGSLDHSISNVTFGARQFIRRIEKPDPWWDIFVSDYSTHVTLFLGSSLNEPLMEQALDSRGDRGNADIEGRKRGFLVCDKVDPLLEARLGALHLYCVRGTIEDFVAYLDSLTRPRPNRFDVLAAGAPHVAQFGKLVAATPRLADSAADFLSVFEPVRTLDKPRNHLPLFHHGAAPTWQDIAAELDAEREVTVKIRNSIIAVFNENKSGTTLLVGHRGSGKSTALMRIARDLTALGIPTYFTDAEASTFTEDAARFLTEVAQRVALVIDNLDRAGARGFAFLEAARASRVAPVVLASARPGASGSEFADELDASVELLGEMSESDIRALTATMRNAKTLNVLQSADDEVVYREFRLRAKKQMLVAMKEVTNGYDFDRILRKELSEIESEDLRLSYVTVCLATEVGLALPIEILLRAVPMNTAELTSALVRDLRMIIVRTPGTRERYSARHSVIAECVIKKCAPQPLLARAYQGLLPALVSFMDGRGRGEPRTLFAHYKRLVNHKEIYARFGRDVDVAREIFRSVEPFTREDPHFWLQFGSLELAYGEDLDNADLYLTRAAGLAPTDFFIRVALADLHFARAIAAESVEEALGLRDQASAELDALADERGADAYPRHILLTRSLRWLEIWERDPRKLYRELKQLAGAADEACATLPLSSQLAEIREQIKTAYLSLAANPPG